MFSRHTTRYGKRTIALLEMEDPSSSRFPTLLPPQTAKKYHSKGKNMKVVASLIAITLGMFIILLGIFGAIAESNFRFFVAFLLISLMSLLPGVWTLLHQRREKTRCGTPQTPLGKGNACVLYRFHTRFCTYAHNRSLF